MFNTYNKDIYSLSALSDQLWLALVAPGDSASES